MIPIPGGFIWPLICYIFWHSFRHFISRSIWQLKKLTSLTWILTFYLSYNLLHVLAFIPSGIDFDILSDIHSAIASDILSGSFWHTFWHSIWHTIRHSIQHNYILTCILAFYLTVCLTSILTFYLALYLYFISDMICWHFSYIIESIVQWTPVAQSRRSPDGVFPCFPQPPVASCDYHPAQARPILHASALPVRPAFPPAPQS